MALILLPLIVTARLKLLFLFKIETKHICQGNTDTHRYTHTDTHTDTYKQSNPLVKISYLLCCIFLSKYFI